MCWLLTQGENLENLAAYTYFATFLKPPPLCWRHTTFLLFSFYPSVFDSSITQIQHSLQKISSCMTANLLTLNSSKTECLLVGLPQQLAKINTSSLTGAKPREGLGEVQTPTRLKDDSWVLHKSDEIFLLLGGGGVPLHSRDGIRHHTADHSLQLQTTRDRRLTCDIALKLPSLHKSVREISCGYSVQQTTLRGSYGYQTAAG